ncbi:MAG: hypothetical protein O2976_02905, partial [Actinomycetota bacterium]|nr:hypothetical protein [Actinomycetota bacterium]
HRGDGWMCALPQNLGVGGTGECPQNSEDDLTGRRFRNGDILQAEVSGAMKDEGAHGRRRYQQRASATGAGTLRPDE